MDGESKGISIKKVFLILIIFLFFVIASAIYEKLGPLLSFVNAISSSAEALAAMNSSAGEFAEFLEANPTFLEDTGVEDFQTEEIIRVLKAVQEYNDNVKREVTVAYEYTHYKGKVESWDPETGEVSITGWEETYQEETVTEKRVCVGQVEIDNHEQVERERKLPHGPSYMPPPETYTIYVYETIKETTTVDKTRWCAPVIEKKSDQITLSRLKTESENDILGEDIFELDWRPILALCSLMTSPDKIEGKIEPGSRKIISDEDIDKAIDFFGYQYSYIDDATVEKNWDASNDRYSKRNAAYRLVIEGAPVVGEVCEFNVRKIPQIAPKLIANTYLSYEYEYVDQGNGTKLLSSRTVRENGTVFLKECQTLVEDFDAELFAERIGTFSDDNGSKYHFMQLAAGIFYEDRTEDPEKCPCIGTIVSSSSGWVVHSAAQFYAGIVGLSDDGAPRPSGATVVSSVDWRPSQAALSDPYFRRIWETASSCLGIVYDWGGDGRDGRGFDCSGFVSYVYTKCGHPKLGRQTTFGLLGSATGITDNGWVEEIVIDDPEDDMKILRPGDLIFFKGTISSRPKNQVSHVAIYLGEGMMIHASGSKGVTIASYECSNLRSPEHRMCFGRMKADKKSAN